MPTLQIRDVPADVLEALRRRSLESGQSLQAYARTVLSKDVEVLSPREAAARAREIGQRTRVTEDDIVDVLKTIRQEREV